eukprot:symbB.v1.2.014515.t1/scaffold1064.1/size140376/1
MGVAIPPASAVGFVDQLANLVAESVVAPNALLAERRVSEPVGLGNPSAASCGAALFNCVLRGDWDEESGESTPKRQPMTKAKSNPQVPNNATGDGTPVSSTHKRMSSTVQYKGFISQHSSDISVYDRYDFGELLGEGLFWFQMQRPSIESFLLFAMGCNATKAEISSFEKDSSNMDQLQPFSSWDITSKQVLHEAARGFPPTRRTHERHLLALDRFLQGVQACPHGFNKTVEQYRAALKAAEHMEMDYMEESNEPMISTIFCDRERRSGTPARRLSGKDGARAIKKVPKRRVSNSTESFLAEVEVLKQLDHPNICKLYEVFEDDDNIFLDLCRGGELFERITQGELGGEAQVAKLIRQLSHAVRYCHDRGIIHRDIKPENILFVSTDSEAPAKLIDFGIACHFKQTEHRKDEKGTEAGKLCYLPWFYLPARQAYLAPEVKNNSSYSEKCDLWSLGVLLYAMLSGSLPFKSAAAARSGDFSMEAAEWQTISQPAKDLIRQLLVVDPLQRLSAAKVLEHPWVTTGSLEEETVPAQTTDLSDLFETLDADGSGAIDYSEFMAAAIDRKIFFREDLCLQVFGALDRDASGTISIQAWFFCGLLATETDLLGNELRDEVMELLDRYDSDGDGELNFREFMALLTQNREGSPPKRLQKRGSKTTDSLLTKYKNELEIGCTCHMLNFLLSEDGDEPAKEAKLEAQVASPARVRVSIG